MTSTANRAEIENFTNLAMHWWDEQGPMQPLHRINLVRMPLLRRWIEQYLQSPSPLRSGEEGLRERGKSKLDKSLPPVSPLSSSAGRLRSAKRELARGGSLSDIRILDVGCGGGLVCEPLARLGAKVTGIDAGQENIDVAKEHATLSGLDIYYECTTAENFQPSPRRKPGFSRADKLDSGFRRNDSDGGGNDEGLFDVVLALEIIEHVDEPELFVQSLLKLARPGGVIIVSTLNRNPKSFALGIIAAEYILRWLPRGTHNWKKFKKPSEIAAMMGNQAKIVDITGMLYDPLRRSFTENPKDLDVNYFLCAVREK